MVVRNYNSRGKNIQWEKSRKLVEEANKLLEEQLDEDTPEANKEDIIRLLVNMAAHLDDITKASFPNLMGG